MLFLLSMLLLLLSILGLILSLTRVALSKLMVDLTFGGFFLSFYLQQGTFLFLLLAIVYFLLAAYHFYRYRKDSRSESNKEEGGLYGN